VALAAASTVRESTTPRPKDDFSVVICAYADERWELLTAAVESAWAQTKPPVEVVVAADHNPRLAERARTAFKSVTVVENTGERGLSGTRNAGLAATRGAIVAFLDDDAVAAPDWLERLADAYEDDRVLGVGGAIEPRWEESRPRSFPPEFDWVVGCSYRGLPRVRAPVRNVIGANMSVRRDVLDGVGGFTVGIGRVGSLPVGCEETELCIRARRQRPGGEFLFEPTARVSHTVPRERARWTYFLRRCFAEGVSKAAVAASTAPGAALSSERSYVARTLPAAVARDMGSAFRGDALGLARAALIASGLASTTAGYLVGSFRIRPGRLAPQGTQDGRLPGR
jgi:GT2 family glycosyltransferase